MCNIHLYKQSNDKPNTTLYKNKIQIGRTILTILTDNINDLLSIINTIKSMTLSKIEYRHICISICMYKMQKLYLCK